VGKLESGGAVPRVAGRSQWRGRGLNCRKRQSILGAETVCMRGNLF
jgi:hypothetical protein